jgi:hypothetical protein
MIRSISTPNTEVAFFYNFIVIGLPKAYLGGMKLDALIKVSDSKILLFLSNFLIN